MTAPHQPLLGNKTFKEIEAELEAVFRALPISRPRDGRIPVEWTMPELVRELATLRDHKRQGSTWNETKRKLLAMKKYANAVLKDDPLAIAHFPFELRILVGAVADAEFPGPPSGRGQPQKTLARKVARITAERFFALTQKRPTRITPVEGSTSATNPFVELLDKVYRILGIKASAASQAKAAIRFVAKNYPKN